MAAPRVLVLNERDPGHPRAGGAEVHVAQTFGRLVARGWEVTQLACRFRGAARRDALGGLSIERLAPLPFYYPAAAWRCARDTRRDRYDVVVECLNKLPFFAPRYAGVPVVALCHHLFGQTAFHQVPWPLAASVWTLERLVPALYGRVPFVVISNSTGDDLVARGIDRERVRVSLPGVERPSLAPPPIEARPCRVAYLGRLEPYKRIDVLLRAVARLSRRFPALELVVVGRGGAQASLERLARELDIAERTRFAGFVPEGERDRLLAESRVCVCPSRKEGWGLTVIESNALGTPVVATDAPGLRDSVRDGETGFLVAEGDVAGFAERIGALLSDASLAAKMSEAARRWSEGFDWERAADEMAEAVESVRRQAAA